MYYIIFTLRNQAMDYQRYLNCASSCTLGQAHLHEKIFRKKEYARTQRCTECQNIIFELCQGPATHKESLACLSCVSWCAHGENIPSVWHCACVCVCVCRLQPHPEQDALIKAEKDHCQDRHEFAKRMHDNSGGEGRRCNVKGHDAVNCPRGG